MKEVVVKKSELIEIVKKNRAEHEEIFVEAVEGYRRENEKILRKHIKDVRKGKVFTIRVNLPMPSNHIDDYDRVVRMLEMSVDDEITLDENSFASYVMDDWDWKQAFLATNSSYSASAYRLSQ